MALQHTYGCAFPTRGGVCDCGAFDVCPPLPGGGACARPVGHSGPCRPASNVWRRLVRWAWR